MMAASGHGKTPPIAACDAAIVPRKQTRKGNLMSHSFFIRSIATLALAASSFFAHDALAQCADGATGRFWWHAGNTHHLTGSYHGSDWRVRPGIDKPGYMVYGPYDTRFGRGEHKADYYLQVDDNTTSPNTVIASLKVYTRLGGRILAHRDLTRRDFTAANTWQFFTVRFDNPCFEQVETAIYWHGNAQFVFGQVFIEKQ